MAPAIAMTSHYWDKFQARHQAKLRGDPLIGMQMLMTAQRRKVAGGGDLAEANNKRSRTERSSSDPPKKLHRLSLTGSTELVGRSRSCAPTPERDSLPCGSASPKRSVVIAPRCESSTKSCRKKPSGGLSDSTTDSDTEDPDDEQSLTQPKPLLVDMADFDRPETPDWFLVWDFNKFAHYHLNCRTFQSRWPRQKMSRKIRVCAWLP